MREATNWLPGLVVLGLAALSALAFLLLSRRKPKTAAAGAGPAPSPFVPGQDARLLDLERRAQLLVDQLRELAAEKHHMGEAEFALEKARLERDAAAALRERDTYVAALHRALASGGGGASADRFEAKTRAEKPLGFWARHPQLKGALWGALIVGFFAGLGLLLKTEEKPRGENGTLTGKDPNEGLGGQTAAFDAQLNQLKEQVQRNPSDVAASAMLGHAYIMRQRFDEASETTKRALAQDPFHLEHRVHSAVLKGTQGDVLTSFRELEHLSRVYPDSHEALFFLGAMSLELGDAPRALDSFERFAATAPPNEQPPELRQAIQELRAQVRGTP